MSNRSQWHIASSWNPFWLGSALKLWFDPENGITKAGMTDRVSAWADRTGNLTVAQGMGSRQPLWVAAASEMNGRQSIQYDGARVLFADAIPESLRVIQQAHSYIAVVRGTADIIGSSNVTTGNMLLMLFSQKVRSHVWASALTTVDGNTTVSTTTRALVGQIATGPAGSGTLYSMLNGQQDVTPVNISGTPVTPATSFCIGSRATNAGSFNGYLGDVVVVNRALTQFELTQLWTWSRVRWGL